MLPARTPAPALRPGEVEMMKQNKYLLNTILTLVLGAALLAMVLVRAFAPMIILPDTTVLNLLVVSLAALVLEHYLAPKAERCYVCVVVFAALAFGLLPYMSGFVTPAEALNVAVKGGITFGVATFLFTSIQDRLSTGPAAKAAPVFSALGLYLAAQCLNGIF